LRNEKKNNDIHELMNALFIYCSWQRGTTWAKM